MASGGCGRAQLRAGFGRVAVDEPDHGGYESFHEPGEATTPGSALTFTSGPLARDHVLLGHASLALRAQLTAPDANFYVQLLDVDGGDKEALVNDGFLKASHRNSHVEPEFVQVGTSVDYKIAIRPQHYRFAKGHRVRIRLWGGANNALAQPAPVDVSVETRSTQARKFPAASGW
jgi:uncharacterized protein